MPDTLEIKIPSIPGVREIVLREGVLLSLDSASADVRVETILPSISRVPPPPAQLTSTCDTARIWTLSGSHMTGADGTVAINLNKFLDCAPVAIEGIIYSNFIGSRPHFAATPESEGAVFLTCTIDAKLVPPPQGQVFLPQALDVTVTVRTWNPDGTRAVNIDFNWIAITRTASVSNF